VCVCVCESRGSLGVIEVEALVLGVYQLIKLMAAGGVGMVSCI
jgi:hypothetical protein